MQTKQESPGKGQHDAGGHEWNGMEWKPMFLSAEVTRGGKEG